MTDYYFPMKYKSKLNCFLNVIDVHHIVHCLILKLIKTLWNIDLCFTISLSIQLIRFGLHHIEKKLWHVSYECVLFATLIRSGISIFPIYRSCSVCEININIPFCLCYCQYVRTAASRCSNKLSKVLIVEKLDINFNLCINNAIVEIARSSKSLLRQTVWMENTCQVLYCDRNNSLWLICLYSSICFGKLIITNYLQIKKVFK